MDWNMPPDPDRPAGTVLPTPANQLMPEPLRAAMLRRLGRDAQGRVLPVKTAFLALLQAVSACLVGVFLRTTEQLVARHFDLTVPAFQGKDHSNRGGVPARTGEHHLHGALARTWKCYVCYHLAGLGTDDVLHVSRPFLAGADSLP